ncbi:MAG TPA: hypothetical protein VHN80_20560 [Kineosporiaceae bacterium]|jgi:hypothetical protein|nr:hypothetical protein [Kineosporiaceae bacterium]
MSEPLPDDRPAADPVGDFWRLGPLPPAVDDLEPEPALDHLGRPEITIAGRNLADLLRPAYAALTAPPE